MRHYCTYFDRRYLPRGLALFHSLRTQAQVFCLHVLCLDDTCYDILVRANFEQLKPIRLPDLEAYDAELASARGRRTLVEYYFTLTAALPLFLFDSDPSITLITYLDSDLFFFGNPEEIFEEMGSASVLIVGHRFPPAGKFREINGIYNVSFISWRSDKDGPRLPRVVPRTHVGMVLRCCRRNSLRGSKISRRLASALFRSPCLAAQGLQCCAVQLRELPICLGTTIDCLSMKRR